MNELLSAALNLPVFALVLCRTSGLMLAAPVLSSISIPPQVKVGLTAILALVMYPFAYPYHGDLPPTLIGYLPLMLSELGMGLVFGFAGAMILAALEMAGDLITQEIGLSMTDFIPPDSDDSISIIAVLLGIVGTLAFLAIDGHHWFIQALATSYRETPIGHARWGNDVGRIIYAGFDSLLLYGLRLAAPLMAIMFLVNAVVGLASKAVPQFNVLAVGYPAKIFVGLFALALTFPLMRPVIHDAFQCLERQLVLLTRAF